MRRLVKIAFIVLMISCTRNTTHNIHLTDETEKSPATLDYFLSDTIFNKYIVTDRSDYLLNDTVLENYSYNFYEITKEYFINLSKFTIDYKIPQEDYSKVVQAIDSCKVIKLQNNILDTLCDFSDGEYFEKYEIISDWSTKNQILIHFDNWEESHEFLLSKKDGSIFILTPDYKLSSDQNRIATYSNIIDNPLYGNHFGVSYLDSDKVQVDIEWEFEAFGVFIFDWINDTLAVIKSGLVDLDSFSITEDKYYIMMINE